MSVLARLLSGVVLAVALLAWLSSSALADYPPAIGSVSAAAGSTTAVAGSNVNVTCTVQDASGAPMADQACVFTIISQPGNDASIGSLSTVKNTDANGIATAVLFTGSTPGSIVVRTEAGGIFSQVTVSVQGAPQQLPTTGGAPADGSMPWRPLTGPILLGMGLILASALIAVRVRRIRA